MSKKDTVIVPYGGYVVIRFVVDNPGWWFFHCHIEIHQTEGMAAVVTELPDEINYHQQSNAVQCPAPDSSLQTPYITMIETIIVLLCVTLLLIE